MIHYLYLIQFENGKKYVGARSTNLDSPELDTCYLGSGRALPERTKDTCTKTILGTFNSRKELIEAETQYIRVNDCVNSNVYYNLREKNYDKFGVKCEAISKALKGRTKESHEYIQKANSKREKYKGDNRTPAQKHQDAKMTGVSQGTNPKKGHKGTTNCAFEPWYSISPEGNRIEYYSITKRDAAHLFGLTPRQMTHRFHYTNIDKPAKQGKIKGWVFGNIV